MPDCEKKTWVFSEQHTITAYCPWGAISFLQNEIYTQPVALGVTIRFFGIAHFCGAMYAA